jgi:hypothetical protein
VGEPNLEAVVTGAVKDAFFRDGRLVVLDHNAADSTLNGVIDQYLLRPVAYDESNRVTAYQVSLVCRVSLFLKGKDAPYLSQRVETNWRYDVQTSVSISEGSRADAIDAAAAKMAEEIVTLVLEAF